MFEFAPLLIKLLVRTIFNPEEAETICGLPLSFLSQPNTLIWAGTSQGIFTVRSAYHFEHTRRTKEQGECSRGNEVLVVWTTLWSLKVLGALKLFLWKVCNNALPTKENLYRRKITKDPLCPVCESKAETIWHVLWECRASMGVWQESNKRIHKLILEESDGLGLVSQFITKLDHESLLEALSVARLVWHRRNGLVHGGGITGPKQVVTQARTALHLFSEVQGDAMVYSPAHRIVIQMWMKPSPGWVNWDVAVSSTEKTMGVGVVVRDAEGSFMAGLTASLPYVRDPLIAEMVAARGAVELGREMGCQRIILEGDSLIIVTALNKDHPCSSSYGQVIDPGSFIFFS